MTELVEKAVWLESQERVRDVIKLMGRLYDNDIWQGGLLFRDLQGGFLLVVTFNPDTYLALGTPFETLFPASHLRPVTLEEACTQWRRYRPCLSGDMTIALRALKLLPA